MWSLFAARPFDTLSTRRITVFLLAIIVAIFSATAVYTVPAQAQATTDVDIMATWSDDNLEYNGWTLLPSAGRNAPSLSGTVCANSKDVYFSDINRDASNPGKAVIVLVCLDKDATIGDKSQSIPAQVILYRADEGTTSASKFQPSEPTAIKIAPLGTDATGNKTDDSKTDGATSCDSTYTHGIGWIICPVTNFLASGMDWLFKVLSGFLVVQPLTPDQDGVIFRSWGFMRNLANVLFVVGFLIIIYSQITSFGLSNYGVKRLLPRLVIAALLVNVSYWIAAVAIDVSNILGFAFQQMFESMRNSLDVSGGSGWQIVNWESISGFILSGGAIVAGVGVLGAGVVTAGVGASVVMLLPILLGVILSALVAILVLAARQALITVLVILSPLACVAYLLPNTEKYFERWRELFTTMLLVFPIFSIVFGGAQLAGMAIILSAKNGGPNSINMILLGMAVQVAPLAITPLLIRVSGNLMGRIAGIVNNPNKGLIDRSRKFAGERAALSSARRLGARNPDGSFRHNWPATRVARRLKYGELNRADSQKAYESSYGAGAKNTTAAHRAHAVSKVAHIDETRGENEADYLFNEAVRNNTGLRRLDTESRVRQQEAAYSKARNDNAYERMKANPTVDTALGDLALRAQTLTEAQKTEDNRLNTAKRVQDSNYVRRMVTDRALQNEAGDREIDEYGAIRVKAAAQAQSSAAYQERIKNFRTSFGYENISETDALQLALGHSAAGYDASDELQEAAIEHVIGLGHVETIIDLQAGINLTTSAPQSVRQTYAAALKSSPVKPKFVPTSALTDAIPQGLPDNPANRGQNLINEWMVGAIIRHKYDAAGLNKTDPDDINYVRRLLAPDPATGAPSPVYAAITAHPDGAAALDRLREDIKRNFKDEQLYRDIGNRLDPLRSLGTLLHMPAADLQP